jgi:hypothetical protein
MFSFCNNETNTKESADTSKVSTENEIDSAKRLPDEDEVDGCFMLILKRDTMVLHLQNNMNVLYGKLTYDNFEKDGSSGNVEGNLEGDILKLKYSFASEGMNSVMDVYFKVDGDKLIRGISDMQTKGDTAYFTNPNNVDFSDKNYFEKVACENVPAKYRL